MDSPAPPHRRRRLLLLLCAGVGLGLLLSELVLRFVLFSDLAREMGIGWRLRNAALYTPREAGRETWKLRRLLEDRSVPSRSPDFHPTLGWLRADVDPVTFEHASEARLGTRRPVLLFGDSYAQCVSQAELCWEDLLERDPLDARYALLNYGVGGYGLDQVFLLMESVLERFSDRDPLVVIGILIDDDLDRSYLGLRGFPKPRFTLEGSELVLHPLEQVDTFDYLAAHGLGIRSYLWRWLLFGSGWVSPATALAWTDEADHVAVKEALNRRLLEAIRDSLVRRELESFVVLFRARRSLESSGPYRWQEPLLRRTLADLGLPFVSSKRVLDERLVAGEVAIEDLYIPSGPGLNHYTAAANRIVFEALRAGLLGQFEPQAAPARR